MSETKKKRGRPVGYRTKDPASELVQTRVTKSKMKLYKATAKHSGQTFSAWVRSVLDKASN